MSIDQEFQRAFRVHQEGKLREAFLRYDAILKAAPSHAPSLHYSGVVLYQAGKLGDAAERIRASLQLDPSVADAWSNLAMVLQSAGRHEAALNALREATQRAPASPEILSNLAASEIAVGRYIEGEATARKAIGVDALHAASWYNLALALRPQGRALEALDAAAHAAAIMPANTAYAGLKAQLEESAGLVEKARTTLEQALARQPTDVALRFEFANLLERSFDRGAAAHAYGQVLALDPHNGAALSSLLHLREELGQWDGLAELQQRFRAGVAAGTPLLSPFVLLSQPSTRAEQRRCADSWVTTLTRPANEKRRRLLSPSRLRVGYLSADFRAHATAYLAAGLFESHDRNYFEIVGYSTGPNDRSEIRERVRRSFDRFVDAAGWPVAKLAEQVERDRLDILVDLKGHTEGASPDLLALRPAPIQVHYLGYPGTLGGTLADYLIGDTVATPLEHAADYTEKLALLPHSYQVNTDRGPLPDPPPRAELGLPTKAVVLCCFNRTYKISPAVFDAWTRVAARVPEAVLWLLARDQNDPAIAALRGAARQRGLAPQRVVFASRRSHAEHLALYRHADLFLDTWPYNAHTTASDALWVGCPVVTWLGETFAGRVAASLLHAVGLPQLVARDVDDFVTRAVALAHDETQRRELRNYLEGAGRASPLFDTTATTRALERAYVHMAEQYRRRIREPILIES